MKKFFTLIALLGTFSCATMLAQTSFPGDPGDLIVDLETVAADQQGDSIEGYFPTGAGSYTAGTTVTVTAREIPGYTFEHWDDEVTDQTRSFVISQSMSMTAFYTRDEYTITFEVNGEEVQSGTYYYGDSITGIPEVEDIVKEQYTYRFAGWEPQVTRAYGEQTYVAKFDTILNQYVIRFLDWDESLLKADTLYYGTMPEYNGTPTREQVGGTVYTFAGWDSELTTVKEDADYRATYTETELEYNVLLIYRDSTVMDKVNYGTQFSIQPLEIEGYHFVAWDNGVTEEYQTVVVVSDTTITALYEINTYKIEFVNWNEDVLQQDSLEHGTMPQFRGEEPTRAQEGAQVYWFTGWEPEVVAATDDARYVAQFADSTLTFTVVVTNGTQETTSIYPWGTEIELTANAPEGYHFVSWSNGSTDETITVTITSDTTFRSMFLINRYQITFKNWDESILQQDSVNYNVVPEFTGNEPTRPDAEGVHYVFTGWEPEIVAATADQVYTAQFSDENIEYTITMIMVKDGDSIRQIYKETYNQEVSLQYDMPNDYHFIGWSDGNTEMPRTITVTGDATYVGEVGVSYVDIDITANAWNFFCLPLQQDIPTWSQEDFITDELTDVAWGTYNGATRAQAQSGWETAQSFNPQQGYILYSSQAGRLRLSAWPESLANGQITTTLNAYEATHAENANWNFVGNPYYAQIAATSITVTGSEEATATIWNGEGYDNELLSSETLVFTPLQAFFIQVKAAGSMMFSGGNAPSRPAPARAPQAIDNSRIDIHATANGYTDKTRVLFRSNANTKYEAGRDASKFMTATAPIQMYILDEDYVQCAQMVRPADEKNITIGFMMLHAGEIEINMPVYSDSYELYDTYTGRSYELTETVTLYSEAGTYNDRLMLRPARRVPTAIENNGAEITTTKLFINDQLYLLRDGKLFTVQGQEVK